MYANSDMDLHMRPLLKCFFFFLEDDAGGRVKRKRKPSEKVLELQAEKAKKPSKSSKSEILK